VIHTAEKWNERTITNGTKWAPADEIASVLVPLEHTKRTVWATVGPSYLTASDDGWYSVAELQFWKNAALVGQALLTNGNIGRLTSTVGPWVPRLVTPEYLSFYSGVAAGVLGPLVPTQRFDIECDKISLFLRVAENRDDTNDLLFLYGLRVMSEL
jgi:hypothetical protein